LLRLKNIRSKLTLNLTLLSTLLLVNAPRVLASTDTPTAGSSTASAAGSTAASVGGGSLPTTNPFQIDWNGIMGGGIVSSLLPLFNYGLGLYGVWLLFHGIRHLLHRSKRLMTGEGSYKEFIPVVAGFVIVLLVLSGAWYHLLLSVLVPMNNAFQSTPSTQ
jgi:hypothetical protein